MNKLFAFLPVAALLAAPAAAVTVTNVSATNGNSVAVVTQMDGLLEVDVAIRSQSPVALTLAPSNEMEMAFEFNSLIDFLTAVEVGNNVRSLSLGLEGALFQFVGSIEPTFATASWVLNEASTLLTITFDGVGEPNAVVLGNLFGGNDFVISFMAAESAGDVLRFNDGFARNLPARLDDGPRRAVLTIQAAVVPEPATWAMMIAGFGLVGAAARRRAARVAA